MNARLAIADHTIATVPARMGDREDPMREVLRLEPDLKHSLGRLQAMFAGRRGQP